VDPERVADAGGGVARGELADRAPGVRPDRGHQDAGDAGGDRARDHRVAIGVERRDVEVAMGVDHTARCGR
jgi:hypothetical protein